MKILISICIILSISFSITRKFNTMANTSYRNNFFNYSKPSNNKPRVLKGTSYLFKGYNLSMGNPLFPITGDDTGFTAYPIFDQKYKLNNITPDGLYKVPDGLHIDFIDGCNIDHNSSTINSESSLKRDSSITLGLDASYSAYAFSMNTDITKMTESINNENKVYVSTVSYCPLYKSIIQEDAPPLNPNFIKKLNFLKGKSFEKAKDNYFEVFKNYGTHYLSEIEMGSKFVYILNSSKKDYENLVSEGLDISAKASAYVVSVSSKFKSNKTATKKDSHTTVKESIKSIGAQMPSSMNLEDWLKKTSSNPMPIKYKLEPITSLLDKGYPELKVEFEKAYKFYCEYLKSKNQNISCEPKLSISEYRDSTALNDSGRGNLFYLDRQSVMCNKHSALKSFKLSSDGGNEMNYNFSCLTSEYISDVCVTKFTPANDVGGEIDNSAHFLNRHFIVCDDKQALRNFKLERAGNKIYYSYLCCNVSIKECKEQTSNAIRPQNFNTLQLSLLNVNTSSNDSVIINMILRAEDNGAKLLQYAWNECKLG